MAEERASKKSSPMKYVVAIIGVVLLVAAIVIAGYFYMQYKASQDLLKNPNAAAAKQTQELIDTVGKLIQLPAKETPTVATVSDASKLANQPFFTNAKNGDKVLIYTTAKEAILYRPLENKIIAVAPVNIGQASPTPSVTPTKTVKKVTPTPSK